MVSGQVARIDSAVLNGTVTVDVALEGPLPKGARPDLMWMAPSNSNGWPA